MHGNHWEIQIEKKKKGGMRLKFTGYFQSPIKCMITIVLVVIVCASGVPYLFRF